jgi:alpha-N-arabinofuranosidase
MSDWVEYCNLNIGKYGRLRKSHGVEEPLNVKYWSIGNENWGSWEIGGRSTEEWGPRPSWM